jgi:hypothetical protein
MPDHFAHPADEPRDPADAADDALARRLAAPLRAAERPDADFGARVMAAVRADAPRPADAGPTPWWHRSRGITLSPLAGLALAAGFAGVVVAAHESGRAAPRDRAPAVAHTAASPGPARAGVADTVHVVRFVFVDRAARRVTLVGDFNGWDRAATQLVRTGARDDSTVWTVSVALPPGRHEYAFVVDGERWVADSAAPVIEDEFGTRSSVVTLDGPGRPEGGRSL